MIAPRDSASDGICVLGIDPGLADVGYGLVEWSAVRGSSRLIDYGVVQTAAGQDLAPRLEKIFEEIQGVIERCRPVAVAIEQLFFARNVKTAMVVAHGRAACVLATARRRVPLFEYTPLQIKQALTGHGRAGKMQVQLMVKAVLGMPEIPRPDHAADALAAALCHVHSMARRGKIEQAQGRGIGREAAASEAAGEPNPLKLLLAQSRRAHRRRRQNRHEGTGPKS